MQSNYLTQAVAGRALNNQSIRSLVGSNVNRQTRQNARAERRRGNWDILGIDTALLWAVDAYLADTDDNPMCAEPLADDIWP
jgi:hypothetical protein